MSQFVRWPSTSGSIPTYSSYATLPATANDGAVAVTLDTDSLYVFHLATLTWLFVGGPGVVISIGTIDSVTASANGAVISSNALIMQSASATRPGLVNTTTQTMAGNKTFSGTIAASNLSGTNTGDVTLASVGAIPAAAGASLSGQVLTLQPADGTNPGVVTAVAQTLAGAKTFSTAPILSSLSASLPLQLDASKNIVSTAIDLSTAQVTGNLGVSHLNSGTSAGATTFWRGDGSWSVPAGTTPTAPTSIGAFSNTSTANGLDITSNVLTLHAADGTNPGAITADAQTIAGAKTFSSTIVGNISGNAATVTTNANLTGVITSVGNATSIASQTGTGTKFVVDNTPTLITPNIGAATGTSLSVSGQLTSTVSTGTAPLVVSSTTQVANLNAATAGSATTATTATNSTNSAITDDTTTNATMYPAWVTTTTGNLPLKVSSTKLTFNPSTAALTTTTFVGALTGTASGNTTYSANQYGLVTSGSGNAMTVIAPNASTALPLISGGASAVPTWAKLAEAGGGTNQTSYTTGDILYASATNTLSKLAAGTNGYVLTQGATVPSWVAPASANSSMLIQNVGLTATVAANALTIALKQSDASTDPTSGNPCIFGFRNSTTATGSYSLINATAATSLVISSGSTMGQVNGAAGYIYVYVLNNAGTVELAASGTLYDDGSVVTTVAEGGAGAADSRFSVYSTTQRTGVAIRCIGRVLATEATAGTWASAVTEISPVPFFTGRQTVVGTAQTSNGALTSTTFVAPTNTPTITFTPGKTGRHKIYCSGIAQNGNAVEDSCLRINATAGSPVVVFSEESCFTAPGAGYRVPFSVYQLVWLTNGTSYTFQLEGKATAGTLTITNSFLASGIALIAEQAD